MAKRKLKRLLKTPPGFAVLGDQYLIGADNLKHGGPVSVLRLSDGAEAVLEFSHANINADTVEALSDLGRFNAPFAQFFFYDAAEVVYTFRSVRGYSPKEKVELTRFRATNPAKSRNPHNHWVQNGWAITYTEGMYSSRVKAELSGWKNSFHDTFRVTAEETYKGSKEFDVTVEGGEVDTNSLGWAKFKEYAIERGVTKKDAKTLLFTTAQVILGFKPDPKKAGGEVENRVKNGALEFRTKSHRDQVAQLLRRHPQSFGSRVFEQDSRSRSAGRSKKSPAYLIVAPGVGQDELSRWWQRAVEADHARNPQKPKRK